MFTSRWYPSATSLSLHLRLAGTDGGQSPTTSRRRSWRRAGASAAEVRRRMFRDYAGRSSGRSTGRRPRRWKHEHANVGVTSEVYTTCGRRRAGPPRSRRLGLSPGPSCTARQKSLAIIRYPTTRMSLASCVAPHVRPEFWGKLGVVVGELGACVKEPLATWIREAPEFGSTTGTRSSRRTRRP